MLGAAQVLSFTTLIMMFFGAIAGIIAAAIPGFTVTMAIVLTLPLAECSMKARTGGPVDDPEDLDEPAWAGLIPIGVAVPPGASCATVATLAPRDSASAPPSGSMVPDIKRSRVVLPLPLRPTRPMRRPRATRADASCKRSRPPMRYVREDIVNMSCGAAS